ncbi:hypothetical protein M9H77_31754 [Catharanthus roseus]|uniref:Uncharacterized protein n=1 Tax=Catharanthus roseus TaxID=4058 RepID=A0ACC0A107_CATRO|nr:hypothetical protein M9H77_31754 [Catharanthus roseus]
MCMGSDLVHDQDEDGMEVKDLLRNLLGDAWEKNKRPSWIDEKYWAEMNRTQRQGGQGPEKHTDGSISFIEMIVKWQKDLIERFSRSKYLEELHQHQNEKKKGEYILVLPLPPPLLMLSDLPLHYSTPRMVLPHPLEMLQRLHFEVSLAFDYDFKADFFFHVKVMEQDRNWMYTRYEVKDLNSEFMNGVHHSLGVNMGVNVSTASETRSSKIAGRDPIREMIFDAAGPNFYPEVASYNYEEAPDPSAKIFMIC